MDHCVERRATMRRPLIFTFVAGLAVGLLLSKGGSYLPMKSAHAAPPPSAAKLELDKDLRSEIREIAESEFEIYATKDGLTSEGRRFVRAVAEERVGQLLTQETSRQIRRLQKIKPVNINYNKSKVPSPVAMSSNGQIIVVSGSEGILISEDSGHTWEKAVED
jgi:hypothetical protein